MRFKGSNPPTKRFRRALLTKEGFAVAVLALQIFCAGSICAESVSVEQLAAGIAVEYGISTTQFVNCSPINKVQIRQAEQRALKLMGAWKLLLEKQYGNVSPFERSTCDMATHQQVMEYKAHQVLVCVQREMLKGLTYVCGVDLKAKRDLATTLPIVGRQIKLDRRLLAGTIPGDLTGVLVHEASHKCGTNDLAYFSSVEHPHDVLFGEWPSIADTYYYWARYKFCIPGVDCKSK